jgi:hypothetical protein
MRWPVHLLFCVACSSGGSSQSPEPAAGVDLPGGAAGIGLDDLRFSPTLGRLVVAAGRTGNVDLVDPATGEVVSVGGFSASEAFDGSDQQGVESADEGRGLVFAVDRTAYKLGVVDPKARALVASVDLEPIEPDYVRWSEPTSEVWITRPGASRIDVYSIPPSGTPTPVFAAHLPLPGGAEGIAIDRTRKKAYTHSSGGLAVVDLVKRTVDGVWQTGCSGEHGIPIVEEERGFVFAGCASSEVVVLDAKAAGKQLARFALGRGTTILAYAPKLHHFYLRGDPGTTTVVLGIGADGSATELGRVDGAAERGHCATADDRGNFWVCDALAGRLQRFADPYPPTP